jgi:ubiquinone/menaquinone biosynthesis C-methylase UbiE
LSVEHWETYYRGGALATCPTGPDANYSLDIRDAWVEFFAALPDGACVLDVGTGNGAVALIARDAATAAGKRFSIHGSDLALIDPVRQVPGGATMFDGITFHPGVPTERLPFEPASFDAVSAQFAVEYTDVGRSLGEIFRVLRPGGRARLSVHHADSVITQNAGQTLAHANLVLDETRIYRKLRAFIAADSEAAKQKKAADAWSQVTGAAARLQQAVATNANTHVLLVTLDAVQKLLAARRQLSRPLLEREIDRVERDLRAQVRRLLDLTAAARSVEQVTDMVHSAMDAGFETAAPQPQLQSGDILVAWRLDLSKP